MNVRTYAVIKNGLVENIILVDEDNLPVFEGCLLVPAGTGAEIGGHYDGKSFSPREKK